MCWNGLATLGRIFRKGSQELGSMKQRAGELREFNSMLGHRGCRLAITYPEITEMQARAIFEAAADVGSKTSEPVIVEVMIPLIAPHTASLRWIRLLLSTSLVLAN